jgi:hypothetical protein
MPNPKEQVEGLGAENEAAKQAVPLDSVREGRKDEVVRMEDIPEDPLAMPPPYWRSSGAIFHVLAALESMPKLLSSLPEAVEQVNHQLEQHYEKRADDHENDQALAEFSDICESLWELEHSIKLEAERAILMASIAAEDEINMFCVFNLQRDIAETIEKLSPPEKLLIASGTLREHRVKGTDVYEKARKLAAWRNAFAHGHCVDRPVKSLRHNHLISPEQYPGVPSAVADTLEFVGAFLSVSDYLRSISRNEYTAGGSCDNELLEERLLEIGRFSFVGDEDVYAVTYDAREGGDAVKQGDAGVEHPRV